MPKLSYLQNFLKKRLIYSGERKRERKHTRESRRGRAVGERRENPSRLHVESGIWLGALSYDPEITS